MKTRKITIEIGSTVSIPNNVRMTICEIADLLGVYEQTVRANIKAILKSGVVGADAFGPATVVGNVVIPDFYGLEMIVALAFRVQSPQAKQFREWTVRRMTASPLPANLVIRLSDRNSVN